ncbi:MAG TPA: bifunctional UDP-N-acetylglucosamine diphosphorylase/glucosamine-1-phosphate N-acetyltransferase GlmU [Thermomicrobiales bacterium]|nr:bifunctional UDP-N-acetylglucosamine diphosphorylase/glucosamine-1-phosphate N-acetyltransferase GlmU [Thermomicrobiales bacterium]
MSSHAQDVPDPAPESSPSDVVVAVLAAGHGTRMRSSTPKHLQAVAGVPIVERVIRAGVNAGAARILVMVSDNLADLGTRIGGTGTFETVVQGPPEGTADSVRQALAQAPEARWLVSLLGDSPLLSSEIVRSLIQRARSANSHLTLLTCIVPDAATYGRIDRDGDDRVQAIVEFKNDVPANREGPTEINSGVMVLDAAWAREELARLPRDELTGEFLLTDLVDVAVRQAVPGEDWPVDAYIADRSVSLGVNDRVQLAEADALARERIRERLMREGVTIIGPDTVFIDEDVRIGHDTVIYPHSILRGGTVVGERCEIGPAAVVESAQIGDAVVIRQSTVRDSIIGASSDIGPYAHLRGGCHIGARVHIGSYAEMKNAELADGAKCGHVAYLGDVSVGVNANIGAGTITANYDGERKNRTVIGDRAFVGSNSVLVAPVTVGEGAMTGAGSVVTSDVPDGTLVMGVPARPKAPRAAGATREEQE